MGNTIIVASRSTPGKQYEVQDCNGKLTCCCASATYRPNRICVHVRAAAEQIAAQALLKPVCARLAGLGMASTGNALLERVRTLDDAYRAWDAMMAVEAALNALAGLAQ